MTICDYLIWSNTPKDKYTKGDECQRHSWHFSYTDKSQYPPVDVYVCSKCPATKQMYGV